MLCLPRKRPLSDLKTRKYTKQYQEQLLISFRLLTLKDAPDVLITRCTKCTGIDGESKTLDGSTRAKIEEFKNSWSAQGKRVILLARKTIPKEQMISASTSSYFEEEVSHHARSGLILVGIVGIVGPPRDEIP